METRRILTTVVFAFGLLLVPGAAATHGGGDAEICHTHDNEDVDGEHCHLEVPLAEDLVNAPHPLAVTADRVTRLVAGVVSVRAPSPSDSDVGICRSGEDCGSGERCIGGYCIERSFQPLGTLFDSFQMSVRTGGPGAALRLRW